MRFLYPVLVVSLIAGCGSPNPESPSTRPNFTELTIQNGFNFVHDAAVEGEYSFLEVQGSGGGFFDFDNDGDLDILMLNGSYRKKKPSKAPQNRLFRQEKGGAFKDVTAGSSIANSDYSYGLAAGDIDNDGNVDIYISTLGPDRLYRNAGHGRFDDITTKAGIKDSSWGTSIVMLDYDRDGFLDIYVATYVVYDPKPVCTDKVGRRDYCGPNAYVGDADILYRNNGNGTFTDVSISSGIANVTTKGLGVIAADFNQDAYPDIYVANDGEPNQLWMNQKDGTFQDIAMRAGAAVNAMGQPEAGMGIAVGDVDADLDLDLFITHLRDETNTLYTNVGEQGFQDDTARSGLGPPSVPYTGWGTSFFDYDHDGDLDVAIANGRVIRGNPLVQRNPPGHWDPYMEPNLFFENNGSAQFQDACTKSEPFCTRVENGRALAFGDLDNDGDLDMLLGNCGGPARIYRNDAPKKGHWLVVKAIDPGIKRDAIGAQITVHAGGKRFVRVIMPAYSYLTTNDPRAHFGIGNATTIDKIDVRWPDGSTQTFPAMKADRFVTLEKGK